MFLFDTFQDRFAFHLVPAFPCKVSLFSSVAYLQRASRAAQLAAVYVVVCTLVQLWSTSATGCIPPSPSEFTSAKVDLSRAAAWWSLVRLQAICRATMFVFHISLEEQTPEGRMRCGLMKACWMAGSSAPPTEVILSKAVYDTWLTSQSHVSVYLLKQLKLW